MYTPKPPPPSERNPNVAYDGAMVSPRAIEQAAVVELKGLLFNKDQLQRVAHLRSVNEKHRVYVMVYCVAC